MKIILYEHQRENRQENGTMTKDLTSESQKESIKSEAEIVLREIMSENFLSLPKDIDNRFKKGTEFRIG